MPMPTRKRPKRRKIRTNCSHMLAQFKMKQLTEPIGQISLTRVSQHAEKYWKFTKSRIKKKIHSKMLNSSDQRLKHPNEKFRIINNKI